MIMVFDHKQMSCSTQIGDFLLPSPITYHPVIDAFILQSSSYSIRSYRYASIGAMYHKSDSDKKKVLGPEWSLNIGEEALEILPIHRNEQNVELLILTESILFIITQKGVIRNQKRWDYTPSGIHIYNNFAAGKMVMNPVTNQKEHQLNFIVSSHTHHLMVYEELNLMWAAK